MCIHTHLQFHSVFEGIYVTYVCMAGMFSWYHFALRIYNRFKWNEKELQEEDEAEEARADAIYGDDVKDHAILRAVPEKVCMHVCMCMYV